MYLCFYATVVTRNIPSIFPGKKIVLFVKVMVKMMVPRFALSLVITDIKYVNVHIFTCA